MRHRISSLTVTAAAILLLAGCGTKPAPQQPVAEAPKTEPEAAEPTHAMVGEVQEVDPLGHSLVVKTADGKQHTVETSPETEIRTIKHGALELGKGAAGLAESAASDVRKGTIIAIRYTEKEGKLIAHEIQHASGKTVKRSEVVFHRIERGGEKIVVKTRDGAEEVYEVGKNATVAAGNKLAGIGKLTGEKVADGAKATIHFTEESGRKVVHYVEHK